MSAFIFDGISSDSYGVYVFPTNSMVTAPARQYTQFTVPGRSGIVLIDDGRYDNVSRQYGVVIPEGGEDNIVLLRNALASRVGYCRLTDDFDVDHYYMAVYRENFAAKLDWQGREMAKATLTFNCKPQRYLLSGETPLTITSSSFTLTNPTRFTAKPFMRVYGVGVLGVGSANITITDHTFDYIDIDCESGRAYNGATSLDHKIKLSTIDYPGLEPGSNGISLGSGITRVILTPRWWEL